MSEKAKNLIIFDQTIYPGESGTYALPLPELYNCSPMYMPVQIQHGTNAGPTLLLISAVKSDELIGTVVINKFMQQLNAKKLCGTVIGVPVLNIYELTVQNQSIPSELDILKSFPGSEDGSWAERMAHLFMHAILKNADLVVLLKSGPEHQSIIPQLHGDFDDNTIADLAKAFAAPVTNKLEITYSSLKRTINQLNIPVLVYEAGESLKLDDDALILGVEGLQRICAHQQMYAFENMTDAQTVFSQEEIHVRSPKSGIFRPQTLNGKHVKEGDVLGVIEDPFGSDETVQVKAPHEGIVLATCNIALVFEGKRIFKLGTFLHTAKAEASIQSNAATAAVTE